MPKSNGAFRAVRFTEVVRISEGPLREVPLYFHFCGAVHSLYNRLNHLSHNTEL